MNNFFHEEKIDDLIDLEKYIYRHQDHEGRNIRSKNFVRPQLVNYYSVHQVTQALDHAPVFYGDVYNHVRLHHYRKGFFSNNQLTHYTVDRRLIDLFQKLKHSPNRIL